MSLSTPGSLCRKLSKTPLSPLGLLNIASTRRVGFCAWTVAIPSAPTLPMQPNIRLPSFAPIEDTDRLLDARGYLSCDASLVMTRSLEGAWGADPACAPDAAGWLDVFQKASGKRGDDQAVHLEILHRIAAPCAWAVHSESDPDLSCGLGVLVDDNLGLFDIATRVDCRRQGHAQKLCEGLLAWGARRGARTAFLQVVATNTSAIRLYEKLGFKLAYRYGYRIGEA